MKNIIQFIHTRPYLEKKIAPKTVMGPIKNARKGVDFLFKLGVTKESKTLDFLAEQLLHTIKQLHGKIIKTDGGNILVNEEKKIMNLDFEARVINYTRAAAPILTLSAPMPDDVWDREMIVKDLNVGWWSILKAVAAYHFGLSIGGRRFLLQSRLFPIALEKGNIVLCDVNIPDIGSDIISITGYRGNEKIAIRDKDENKYHIRISYMNANEVYLSIGNFIISEEGRNEYDFLGLTFRGINNLVRADYYFKLGENTGIASHYDVLRNQKECFLYDAVQIVSDKARILLGHDIFLKVVKVEYSRGRYILHFILFADMSKSVKGLTEVYLGEELGKILFERMRHI